MGLNTEIGDIFSEQIKMNFIRTQKPNHQKPKQKIKETNRKLGFRIRTRINKTQSTSQICDQKP